jgi:polyphosphate kinase
LFFNYRVLLEAKRKDLPLYERIKFLSIFSSNLDEFFRVRVASIQKLISLRKRELSKDLDFKPKKVLKQIIEITSRQQVEYGELLEFEIIPELSENGIRLYWNTNPVLSHIKPIRKYFLSHILSYLQPLVFSDDSASIPFLENRALYFSVSLIDKETRQLKYALVNIPSSNLPRFLNLPLEQGNNYYLFLDDAIRLNLEILFPGYEIMGCFSIKLNRDADLHLDDDLGGNLIKKIRKGLIKRDLGLPSRFLYNKWMPAQMLEFLVDRFDLTDDELVEGGVYHNLNDLINLPNPIGDVLESPPFYPLERKIVENQSSMFETIEQTDVVLHFPYHSYEYVLRLFNEAAINPNVSEIKVTLYRVASDSLIVNALISAAKNGKKVIVFVEVKARFDEANNLKWAERMQEAGIKIIYSAPDLKVHAKVALITRTLDSGRKIRYGLFSTGNFNESTARFYCDHSLLTCHKGMTRELDRLFRHLKGNKGMANPEHLLISKTNLQERFIQLIEREKAIVKEGKTGRIVIKINNLEEKTMISALYDAAANGVKIDIIVRSICCARPGIPALGGNLRIYRLIDKYLEHSRVFLFYNNGKNQLFLSSADWMKRNLYHRIEVGFPVYDEYIKEEILKSIELQLSDNTNLVELDYNHSNNAVRKNSEKKVRAQFDFYDYLKSRPH